MRLTGLQNYLASFTLNRVAYAFFGAWILFLATKQLLVCAGNVVAECKASNFLRDTYFNGVGAYAAIVGMIVVATGFLIIGFYPRKRPPHD